MIKPMTAERRPSARSPGRLLQARRRTSERGPSVNPRPRHLLSDGERGAAAPGSCLRPPPSPAAAQYFGRNKVQYEKFDFRVLETAALRHPLLPGRGSRPPSDAARMAERWYARLRAHLRARVRRTQAADLLRRPARLPADEHVIGGFIGEGTGGVTESLKRPRRHAVHGRLRARPTTCSATRWCTCSSTTSRSRRRGGGDAGGSSSLPLWLVEGMAEYLSVGRDDPHTAMWLRDAVLHGRPPDDRAADDAIRATSRIATARRSGRTSAARGATTRSADAVPAALARSASGTALEQVLGDDARLAVEGVDALDRAARTCRSLEGRDGARRRRAARAVRRTSAGGR